MSPASRAKNKLITVFRKLAPYLPFKNILYHLCLKFQRRKNTPYTQFYRFHHQYEVLTEKVIPSVLPNGTMEQERPLDIVMFGCSTGAEPYSLASVLLHRMPELKFHIRAFDCVPELIEKAKAGLYEEIEVFQSPFITDEFVEQTLDVDGGFLRIKEAIKRKVTFEVGNALDADLIEHIGKADLVFAQNFLFHLERDIAGEVFANLVKLLKTRSGLIINGMDYDMRIDLTKKHALVPVDYLVEEVHNDAFVNAGDLWFTRYFGRLPFSTTEPDWVRKFSTVFLTRN